MMTVLYEVRSGHPAGEVYHHEVVVVDTKQEAIAEMVAMGVRVEEDGESGDWMYGPDFSTFQWPEGLEPPTADDGLWSYGQEEPPYWPSTWDGHNEVPAPLVG